MISNQERFEKAIARFDEENRKDPNLITFKGIEYPKELLYARQMTDWLKKINPDASESLQLAARSQHICRWTSPRENYPSDRTGYLKWRTELKNFHANKAAEILIDCDYDEGIIAQVKSLIRKEKLKVNPEAQLLEDVVCLVFLENYFEEFSGKHDDEKVVSIIRKTWKKMSGRGHELAHSLDLSPSAKALLGQALGAN